MTKEGCPRHHQFVNELFAVAAGLYSAYLKNFRNPAKESLQMKPTFSAFCDILDNATQTCHR